MCILNVYLGKFYLLGHSLSLKLLTTKHIIPSIKYLLGTFFSYFVFEIKPLRADMRREMIDLADLISFVILSQTDNGGRSYCKQPLPTSYLHLV